MAKVQAQAQPSKGEVIDQNSDDSPQISAAGPLSSPSTPRNDSSSLDSCHYTTSAATNNNNNNNNNSTGTGLGVVLLAASESEERAIKDSKPIIVAGNRVAVLENQAKLEVVGEESVLSTSSTKDAGNEMAKKNHLDASSNISGVQYRTTTSTEFARKRPNSFVNAGGSGNASSIGAVASGSGPRSFSPSTIDSAILRQRSSNVTASNIAPLDKRRNTIAGGAIINPISSISSSMSSPMAGSSGAAVAIGVVLEKTSLSSGNVNAIPQEIGPFTPGITKKDSSASKEKKLGGASLRRKKKDGDPDSDDELVKVGTKVDKGHVNFVQMYDMLTGIRTSVSRCEAKPDRPLVSEDFGSAHKLAFDITGNELTPSSRYDFKFKDYAPWVFRNVRRHFKVDPAEYLISLTGKYVLSELGSPGKSGSFFYFSRDYRFIIKTIHHTEHMFFLKILQRYYEHIKKHPNTLISRFFGLHRVKLPGRKKIHFVVMGNIFPSNKDVHAVYDLKGSTVGRMTKPEEIAKNPNSAVQKDLNWSEQNMKLKLGPAKLKVFLEQLKADCEFLCQCGIMDYSLLLGIHYYSRGNSENLRDKSLSVFEPRATDNFLQGDGQDQQRKINSAFRKAIVSSDPVALGPSNIYLPDELPPERTQFLFYQDEGGLRGTDETDDAIQLDELYYAGIIDILTPYNYVKKFEHAFKAINNDQKMISAVNPKEYAKRFVKFMEDCVLYVNKEK